MLSGVRILLAALRCGKGDPAVNLAAHEETLEQARAAGCALAVFPEMSLSGSVNPTIQPDRLLRLNSAPVLSLVEATARSGVAAVFGIAERAENPHITQVYAHQGQLRGAYRKRHLGEGEHGFTAGTRPALFALDSWSFGVAICAEGGVDYPFDEPAAAGADAILFCAAPGLYGRRTDEASWRAGHEWWQQYGLRQAQRHARRTGTAIAMTTQAGSAEDEDFPGIAALIAPTGDVVDRLPDWRPGVLIVDVVPKQPAGSS
jgi:predicted amidohydrolase